MKEPDEVDEAAEEGAAVRAAMEVPAIPVPIGPITELVPAYNGVLVAVRSGVEGFLIAEGVDPAARGTAGTQLIDSLLATIEQNIGLDWKQRDAIWEKCLYPRATRICS